MKLRFAPALTWITTAALLLSTCAGLTFSQRTVAQSEKAIAQQPALQYPTLSKYGTDLTLLALRGKLPRTSEREAEVDRVLASLLRAESAPVLVGDSDLERNIVARGVALKIALGQAPEGLRTRRVFSLSLDALAEGAQTETEFTRRVKAALQEISEAKGQLVVFIDQLQNFIGTRANSETAAAVHEALESSHLTMIGGTSPESYAAYIAKDVTVARLFESILIDNTSSSVLATSQQKDNRRSPVKEEFEGEKLSSDMQQMIDRAGPNGRVTAILQVDDVQNAAVISLLKRNGATIGERMPQFGAMKVELPAKAIAALARLGGTNYISPDVKLESFGHVTATSGTDLIRTQTTTTTSISLLGLTTTRQLPRRSTVRELESQFSILA